MDAAISLGAQRNDAVGLIRCGVIDQQAILIDWERLMARQSSQCVLASVCVCVCAIGRIDNMQNRSRCRSL